MKDDNEKLKELELSVDKWRERALKLEEITYNAVKTGDYAELEHFVFKALKD